MPRSSVPIANSFVCKRDSDSDSDSDDDITTNNNNNNKEETCLYLQMSKPFHPDEEEKEKKRKKRKKYLVNSNNSNSNNDDDDYDEKEGVTTDSTKGKGKGKGEIIRIPIDFYNTFVKKRCIDTCYNYRKAYMTSLESRYDRNFRGLPKSMINERLESTEERNDPFYCVMKYPRTTYGITVYELGKCFKNSVFFRKGEIENELMNLFSSKCGSRQHPPEAIIPFTKIEVKKEKLSKKVEVHATAEKGIAVAGKLNTKVTQVIPLVVLAEVLELLPEWVLRYNNPYEICTKLSNEMKRMIPKQKQTPMFVAYHIQFDVNLKSMYKEKRVSYITEKQQIWNEMNERIELVEKKLNLALQILAGISSTITLTPINKSECKEFEKILNSDNNDKEENNNNNNSTKKRKH